MTSSFDAFDLRPTILQSLQRMNYLEPTPVQAAAIPPLLDGKDVIAQARTGTGKTAAFGLPALQRLESGNHGIQVLVLSPTRELCIQVGRAFQEYSSSENIKIVTIYGGTSYRQQKQGLKENASVVVGTPGRLLDLVRQNILKLHAVRFLVLDEADEMLSMGFSEELEQLLSLLPKERQTALFSATLPKEIRKLADRNTKDPVRINLSGELSTKNVELSCFVVRENDKVAALTRLLEVQEVESALVFCRTRNQTGIVAAQLTRGGVPAEPLSGAMDQLSRERALKRFRQQVTSVLVATDVAARGLDIDHISHVINMDLPQSPEVFVHRIGRTARAGRTGFALTLVTPREEWKLKRIERCLKRPIEVRKVPTRKEIVRLRLEQLYSKLDKWLGSKRCKKELAWVDELVGAGHSAREIAAAALKLAAANEKSVPIAEMSEVEVKAKPQRTKKKKKSRGSKGEAVQLMASVGKRNGVRPREIVALLARKAGVPGELVGDIRITKTRSFVDVPSDCVAKILAGNGGYRIGNHNFEFKVDG